MNEQKNTYIIISSVIIAFGLISFSIYTTKCYGDECGLQKVATEEKNIIFPKMNPSIINEQVKNKEIFLLDVRDIAEWNRGHIAGAKHIVLDELNIKTAMSIPKEIPVYIYCRSGRRSGEAEFKLRTLGFQNVENIGGIIHWQERGGELLR